MKNYIFNDRKITGQIKYKKICITFSWRIQKVPSRSRDLKNMGIKYEKIEQIQIIQLNNKVILHRTAESMIGYVQMFIVHKPFNVHLLDSSCSFKNLAFDTHDLALDVLK